MMKMLVTIVAESPIDAHYVDKNEITNLVQASLEEGLLGIGPLKSRAVRVDLNPPLPEVMGRFLDGTDEAYQRARELDRAELKTDTFKEAAEQLVAKTRATYRVVFNGVGPAQAAQTVEIRAMDAHDALTLLQVNHGTLGVDINISLMELID